MKLDNYFSIDTDTNCTTLTYKKKYMGVDKEGKEKEKTTTVITYHNNIKNALQEYANKCLEYMIEPNTQVIELLEEQKRILTIINQLV